MLKCILGGCMCLGVLLLAGCKNEDPVVCEGGVLVVPTTYNFVDGAGNLTVAFNGQAQRLEMLGEMAAYIQTAHSPGTALGGTTLLAMYANSEHTWMDVTELGLTGSTKQLKNKTAAASGTADPTIQAYFETQMDEVAALSATTVVGQTDGGLGYGGVVLSTSNPTKQYLQNAMGHEYAQSIEKGLMGAVFYNQICMVYLGSSKMDVDNTAAVDPDAGDYFTTMEHHWDEAYGYFTTATDYPTSGTNRFWGKYAFGVEEILGSASTLSLAFRTGRAAISAKDLDKRDAQIAIIRSEMERVAGGSAIHYLNSAVSNFTDHALRNHALSEASAFMSALPYGFEPALNSVELAALQTALGLDFYDVTQESIIAVRDQLAAALDLEDEKDAL